MPAAGFRIGSAAVILLLVVGSVTAAADKTHLTVGEYTLPPFALTVFCLRKPDRCTPNVEALQIKFDLDHRLLIGSVNRAVNRSIIPKSYAPGKEPPWRDDATVGDCNAFAMKKRSQLLDLKLPSSALLLAVVTIPGGEGHLVLIVVTDQGDFVLDNLSENVVRWDDLPYHWIKRSSPDNPQFWRTIVQPEARVSWSLIDEGPIMSPIRVSWRDFP